MFKQAVATALAGSLVEVFIEKGHFKSKCRTSGWYYEPVTIINDDSRIINKFETSLTDNARVVVYDRHMFIVQSTVLFSFF
jgi:hypothetical protein